MANHTDRGGRDWTEGLTLTGWGWIGLTLAAIAIGLVLGYDEMIAFGLVAGLVMIAAALLSRREPNIEITQRLGSHRVARGDPVYVQLTAYNRSRLPMPSAAIETRLDDHRASEALATLAAGDRVSINLVLPTRRRGSFTIGPATVRRSDPLGLIVTTSPTDAADPVLVHPKVYRLSHASGRMRSVDQDSSLRRRGTDPLSGFVSMREYIQGDDPRLIHWPTTARTGSLMVRETIDFRRPEFLVVVDAAASSADPDAFEEMVDVTATLASHALDSGLVVVVRTTNRDQPGTKEPLTNIGEVLDFLTPLEQADGADVLSLVGLFTGGVDPSATMMITGPGGPSSTLGEKGIINFVRIGNDDRSGRGLLMAAATAADFARSWKRFG